MIQTPAISIGKFQAMGSKGIFLLILFWTFAFLLWPHDSNAQRKRPDYVEVPCSHYYKGKLYHTFHPDSGIQITRRPHRQKDYNPFTGEKRKWKIEWVSDCVYQLTFIKSNMKTKMRPGFVQTDTIIECYNTHYNWNATLNGMKTFGSIARELSKAEKAELAAQKEQDRLDSIAMAYQDSIWRTEGKDPARERRRLERERVAKEAADARAKQDSIANLNANEENPEENEEATPEEEETPDNPEVDKPKGKEKPPKPEKENPKGDDGEKKAKKEKPPKEGKVKKEKPPKEKKAKKEKAPKEKKEKPPKEKKEKPPKEKKEKPEDDE